MRRQSTPEYQLDPEIERTLRELRREFRGLVDLGRVAAIMAENEENQNLSDNEENHEMHNNENHHNGHHAILVQPNIIGLANDRDRPMRDYAIFDPETMNTGIVRPEINANHFEFKPMMFQMLQAVGQFSGSPQEDPHLHLRQFLEVASNFKNPGVSDDSFRLRLFPYSLRDRAKAWLNSLEPNSVDSWNAMAEKFLAKYFPPIKNAKLRNDITSFKQFEDESLYETWERFKELLRKCPHHGIPVCIQMETFYNGLLQPTREMLDASSRGALLTQSYNEAYNLIETIAANSYQWPTTRVGLAKKVAGVHELNNYDALAAQISSLTHMVKNMSTGQNAATSSGASAAAQSQALIANHNLLSVNSVSCVFCAGEHLFEDCPSNPVSMNYVGNFNRGNNPYSNTYNPGWRQHPNFSWSNNAAAGSNQPRSAQPLGFPPQAQRNQNQQASPSTQTSSLEDVLKAFMTETKAQFQSQGVAMRNLENQVGQIASALNTRPSGSLPSNTEIPKPQGKEQCNSITLRTGREIITSADHFVDPNVACKKGKNSAENTETDLVQKGTEAVDEGAVQKVQQKSSAENAAKNAAASAPDAEKIHPKLVPERPPPPFPQRLRKTHQEKQFGKFLEVLKQLHINIPLVEALQQMPNYAKFMKDMLTKKRKLGEFETVAMTKECSLLLQSKVPQKLKDPGSFTIPCSIGNTYSGRALCDLGASINLMPLSIFKQLSIGKARPTTVNLQLADRSIAYPEGKIEDVLIRVDKFVFPVDFIILDFEADKEVPIILGRPFLATGRTLIDVQKGELTMRVNDQEVTFNVFNALKCPDEGVEKCSFVRTIDSLVYKQLSDEHDVLKKDLAQLDEKELMKEEILDLLKKKKKRVKMRRVKKRKNKKKKRWRLRDHPHNKEHALPCHLF